MAERKLLLITGVPGTGKTTVGNYLQEKFGYNHIDFEDSNLFLKFESSPDTYIDELVSNKGKIVITWGFAPDEGGFQRVSFLMLKGFKIIWFDGNRVAAFREYLKAGRPEEPFYFQMFRIENSKVIERINPLLINTFDESGHFRKLEEIVDEIEKKSRT